MNKEIETKQYKFTFTDGCFLYFEGVSFYYAVKNFEKWNLTKDRWYRYEVKKVELIKNKI